MGNNPIYSSDGASTVASTKPKKSVFRNISKVKLSSILGTPTGIGFCIAVGISEGRSFGISNTSITTFYSQGEGCYSREVKELFKDRDTLFIQDEFDKMITTEAGRKAFVKLFEVDKRFYNACFLTATPEKAYRTLERLGIPARVNQFINDEKVEKTIFIKLVNEKGNFIGFVGKNRFKEIINKYIKPSLPYSKGHVLLFCNNGSLSNLDEVQNCILSENNENADHTKLIKTKNGKINVNYRGEGIDITLATDYAERSFSLDLRGTSNHTNIYIGIYNPDVPKQHFQRKRGHIAREKNPNLVFISSFRLEKELFKSKRKQKIFKSIYGSADLSVPKEYRDRVKSHYDTALRCELINEDYLLWQLEEQKKVKFDKEVVLESKEPLMDNKVFESILYSKLLAIAIKI